MWRAAAIQGFALLQQQSANVRTRGFTPSGANVHEEFRLLRALPTFPSSRHCQFTRLSQVARKTFILVYLVALRY